MSQPRYVTYLPVGPTAATNHGPLAVAATGDELRATTVVDPVAGDRITCTELQQRDRECWRDVDARWPPSRAYVRTPVDRARANAARATCRRRAAILLRTCRIGAVRAG
jgi:hypothetical protein